MTDGRLALVFDDGYAEDYDQVRPVLAERGVPASLAVVRSWLGEAGHLTTDRLDALVDAGWEVAAHGRRHRYLGTHHLARDAAAGDDRVALDSDHVFPGEDHGVYPGDTFAVTDGETTERRVLAEKREGEHPQMVFEEPLSAGFDAAAAVVRPTEAQVREEVLGSKADLTEAGYDPTTFVLPYDAGDARVERVVAGAFDALADSSVRSVPNPPGTAPLGLRRYYLETSHMRTVEIESYLDSVAASGGVGVLAGHAAWETVPPERVAAVVDAAQDRGIEVTTVADAVDA